MIDFGFNIYGDIYCCINCVIYYFFLNIVNFNNINEKEEWKRNMLIGGFEGEVN